MKDCREEGGEAKGQTQEDFAQMRTCAKHGVLADFFSVVEGAAIRNLSCFRCRRVEFRQNCNFTIRAVCLIVRRGF